MAYKNKPLFIVPIHRSSAGLGWLGCSLLVSLLPLLPAVVGWVVLLTLTCSCVWDWLVINPFRMVTAETTRAAPLCARWVILQEAEEFWERPRLRAVVHSKFRLDMLNWIPLVSSRGGFERWGMLFRGQVWAGMINILVLCILGINLNSRSELNDLI